MLVLSTIYLLISNALTIRREITIILSRSVMFLCFFLAYLTYTNYIIKLLEKGLALYSGLFFIKPYVLIFTIFIFLLTSLILALTSYYPRKRWHKHKILSWFNKVISNDSHIINSNLEQYKILEYSLLILFILNGAVLLMSSNDLISLFLCVELQSYGLYLLCAVYRDSESSSKAALTYFLLGGLSSCIILLGQGLIYANTGNTSLDGLYVTSNISDATNSDLSMNNNTVNTHQYYMHTSLVVFSVGFLFKISSAPFHNWSPDVYDQIPTIVTTFVAIIAKISILIMLFELVCYTSSNLGFISWKNNLLFSALLSLVIGSVLGLTQSRIKRLYAYSTISHIGFILLSLSVMSVEADMAYFFYILQYSITNLCAFFIIIVIGYSFFIYVSKQSNAIKNPFKNIQKKHINKKGLKKDVRNSWLNQTEVNRNYSTIQHNTDLSNYYKINAFLAICFALTLFSFLGVPPLMGFFAKQMVLSAALDKGFVFMVIISIIMSVISGVYYLRLIKVIFFEDNVKRDEILSLHSEYDKNLSRFERRMKKITQYVLVKNKEIKINGYLCIIVSLINLIIIQYMFISNEAMNLVLLLALAQLH